MDTETSLYKDTKKNTTDDQHYKMRFIYKALLNGWKVKMINDRTFEFTNDNKRVQEQYIFHDFLENFLDSNIC